MNSELEPEHARPLALALLAACVGLCLAMSNSCCISAALPSIPRQCLGTTWSIGIISG